MSRTYQPALAAFILRVALGAMYLVHALLLKRLTFTLAGTAAFFIGVGLPGWLTYVTIAVEPSPVFRSFLASNPAVSRWPFCRHVSGPSCGSTVQMAGSTPLPAVVGSILRS